jgi:hypothetical protein
MSNLLVVKDKVSRYARELFSVVQIDNDGDLIIPYESTKVFIRFLEREVSPEREEFWNKNQLSRTGVYIWAPTIIDVTPTNELYKWIATEGAEYFYGHCRVGKYGDNGNVEVIFEICIPGDTIDPGELKQALIAVATTADDLDDELKTKFGGKRVEDM